MEGRFQVTLEGVKAGEAELRREGLYTYVFCRCSAPEDKIWRLFAGKERLGVLIPRSGELVLETKVASKRLHNGCELTLRDSSELRDNEQFIPIREGDKFPVPELVRRGVLAYRDGVPGLLLRDIHI